MPEPPRALVADETTLVRWALRRALTAAGFTVAEAGTREEVLETLVAHQYRLVVLPLALGFEDMEDIAQAIASPAGDTALIVLTENGKIPDSLRLHARVKAVDKPFSITSLVDAAMTLASSGAEPERKPISL